MDEYWMVNVHRFGRKDVATAFSHDHAAAVRFAQAQTDAGNQANVWDLFAGKPGKSERKSCSG